MRYLKWLFYSCFISTLVFAQQSEWEQQRQQEREAWERQRSQERQAWQTQATAERERWQDMVDRESAAWQAHVAAVKKRWEDIRFSDVKNWVGYDEALNRRFSVDFENGNLQLEVLGQQNSAPEVLRKNARDMLDELLQETTAGSDRPILEDQLEFNPDSRDIPETMVERDSYTAADGNTYEKMTINIPFKQNHLRTRAAKVLPLVKKYAAKYNIDPKLVMAIIHTESAYNPKAISTFRRSRGRVGHAYGLMQLVPYSGGKEAYQYIGGSGEPTPALLFTPERNIELGVVYLHKLGQYYYAGVTDPEKKHYLIAAGYNTGPQNVARGLVGKRDIPAAIRTANGMTPPSLFNHLVAYLPYQETRDYIQKVFRRLRLY